MKSLRLVGAALLFAVLSACASSGATNSQRFDPSAYLVDPDITIEISNHTSSDLEVFALGAAVRYKLGLVATVGTHVFKLPHQLVGDGRIIRFIAVPLGTGPRFAIGTADVQPGDYVELTIDREPPSMRGRERERF